MLSRFLKLLPLGKGEDNPSPTRAYLAQDALAKPSLPEGMELRPNYARNSTNVGWHISTRSFPFATYYAPENFGFSDLIALNEDIVSPRRGFPTHGPKHMEVFTYVLDGRLEHKDTLGNEEVIHPGDVQLLSVGPLVRHSVFNPSESRLAVFLHIWMAPSCESEDSQYQRKNFSVKDKRGKLTPILSPDGRGRSLKIRQDAVVYAGFFNGDDTAHLESAEGRKYYFHVAKGYVKLNGFPLKPGDGVKVHDAPHGLTLSEGNGAEVLAFDLRA